MKPPAQIEESKPSQKEDSHDEVVNEAWEGVDRWEGKMKKYAWNVTN